MTRCNFGPCLFVPIGELRVVSVQEPTVARTFHLCALHKHPVADDVITSPKVSTVEWTPFSLEQWANDGAAA